MSEYTEQIATIYRRAKKWSKSVIGSFSQVGEKYDKAKFNRSGKDAR